MVLGKVGDSGSARPATTPGERAPTALYRGRVWFESPLRQSRRVPHEVAKKIMVACNGHHDAAR